MDIKISPKSLEGQIKVVSSKSLSHRYVIAAALSEEESVISNVLASKDLEATKKALEVLGAKFNQDHVKPADFNLISDKINVNESGSTLRFMIPIYMLQTKEIIIDGENRLIDRPLDVYEQLFKNQNVGFTHLDTHHELPLKVKGKLKAGHYPLRGDVSSQFISGLLFALPKLRGDSVIELLTPLESKGYVDLTLDVLKKFGIHILQVDQYIYIKGSQKYHGINGAVEGDFSQAAFWFVAGLIGNKNLVIKNLNPDSLQGDAEIVSILRQMGGEINFNDGYQIIPSKTKGIEIDLSQIPDLGPILMALAAVSEGKTTFINFERLRIKESDRVDAMKDVLSRFGVEMFINDDKIEIEGVDHLKGDIEINTFNDHRIAMAASILAIKASGDVLIKDAECIQKSYPTFYEVYKNLGGEVIEIR